jgi:hypothetical protein
MATPASKRRAEIGNGHMTTWSMPEKAELQRSYTAQRDAITNRRKAG